VEGIARFWTGAAIMCAVAGVLYLIRNDWATAFSIALGGLVFFHLGNRSTDPEFWG
jgi:thiamine transporter ThiT